MAVEHDEHVIVVSEDSAGRRVVSAHDTNIPISLLNANSLEIKHRQRSAIKTLFEHAKISTTPAFSAASACVTLFFLFARILNLLYLFL